MVIEAAAGCSKGMRRGTNEDNLYFDERILEEEHEGLRHAVGRQYSLDRDFCVAVFDGMGGEECGETASYLAALSLQEYFDKQTSVLRNPRDVLYAACAEMNLSICLFAESTGGGLMGTTVTMLYFVGGGVYVCNLGDSRGYRFRDNALIQITEDHLERLPEGSRRKPGLTQFLGVFPDELALDPYIGKGELQAGDMYLICSDGLTDMLSNVEICAILKEEAGDTAADMKRCVDRLIGEANAKGGLDNITVILCRAVQ